MDRPEVKRSKAHTSLLRNYLVLLYTVAILAAVLVLANGIIVHHNVRIDLTPGKRYSLSKFDKKVLAGLKHNVKVMAFIRTEDPSYLYLANLLFQAAAYTPRLTYEVIDVNKSPALAREYGVSSYGEVIVQSQGRRRDFDNDRADLLIPAILQVSQAQTKHIYFTTGHGERDLYSSDPTLGFSEWRGLLQQNNYQIDSLSLFATGVPADCSVLISVAPEKNFLPEELTELAKYLAHGGHYIALIDPYGSPNLVKFLQQYHMDFTDKVVVDPAYRLTAGELMTTQIPLRSKSNPISRSMSAAAVFSLAREVAITGKAGSPAPDGLVQMFSSEFLRSSHESWGSGDPNALSTGITEFKAGRDVKGPIPVASEVDLAPSNDQHIPIGRMTRIVGFGSSSFASNRFIEMLGNRDLAVSAVNDLAGDQMMIASRERLNKAETAAFYVTSQQSQHLRDLGAIAESLILFAIAIVVFARRRFFA